VEAMGAMVLLPICDTSFTCEDYNTYRAHPWSPFPLRRARPGPSPHSNGQGRVLQGASRGIVCWKLTCVRTGSS